MKSLVSLRRGLRLKLAGIVAAALLLGACAIGAQMAEPTPSIVGRISALRGQVGVTPAGAAAPHQADGRPLAGGERIETDADGRALLRLGSTAVRIGPRADLSLGPLDEQHALVELAAGSIALHIATSDWAERIEVVVPEGRWRALRPGHYRFDRWRDATRATVWEGEARFDSPTRTLRLEAGRRVELGYAAGTQGFEASWGEPVADEFAEWVRRDARMEAESAALRHVSPEMTGWDDLDAHGDWSTHPEWGSVWVPRGVGSDWTPFAAGRWTWSPPWGWLWVDGSRWGFAPSHYGRWLRWRGRWVWAPGPRHEPPRFRPAPPEAGLPPRQRPPVPTPRPVPRPITQPGPRPAPHDAPPAAVPAMPAAPGAHGPQGPPPPAPWIRNPPSLPPVQGPPRPAPAPERPPPASRPPTPAVPPAPAAPPIAPAPPAPPAAPAPAVPAPARPSPTTPTPAVPSPAQPAPAQPVPALPAPPTHRPPPQQPPVAPPASPQPAPHAAPPQAAPPAPAPTRPRPDERRRPGSPADAAPAESPPRTFDGVGPRGHAPRAVP